MIRVLSAALIVACAGVMQAQPAIPRVSVEIVAGAGPHSERSGETWFRDTRKGLVRMGGAVRLFSLSSNVSPIVRVDYNIPSMADKTADCPPAPNGTCRRYFPDTDGFSAGAGLVAAPTPRMLLGATVGLFRSSANRYLALSASYGFAKHFAAVAEWRYMDIDYGSGDRVTFRPIQAGIRVY